MKKLILTALCFLPSLVKANPKSSEWGYIGHAERYERQHLIGVETPCGFINDAKLVNIDEKTEKIGVGYQGVYDYVYTSIYTYSIDNDQRLTQVIIVAEDVANIDNDPISYEYKVTSITRDGEVCTFEKNLF